MLNIKNKKIIICGLIMLVSIIIGITQVNTSSISLAENKSVIEKEAIVKPSQKALTKKSESAKTIASPAAVTSTAVAETNSQTTAIPVSQPNRGSMLDRTTTEIFEHLVMSEAGGGSYELQLAIAELVTNRWESGIYGNSLYEIMLQKNAFSAITNGKAFENQPTDSVKQAVQEALNGAKTGKLTADTYYCCVPEISEDNWMLDSTRATFVVEIENVHFYKPVS